MDIVKEKLQKTFHHQSFQKGQEPIIKDILSGNDVLGVLPTGSGKSLCYQLPATILPGLTVVISPLISLMIDQVRQIKAYYFKEVAALHSFQQMEERKYILKDLAKYKLLFLSPELLQQSEIISSFKRVGVSLICIDEAHCISQWGYDFRPDYLRLHSVIKELGTPTILALTGTATPEIQQDIMTYLQTPSIKMHIHSIEKKNMTFVVERSQLSELKKKERLAYLAGSLQKPILIYFTSRKKSEEIAAYLAEKIKFGRIAFYHAGMQPEDRLKIQEQFIYDQLDIICCTSAFGMGIDKSNIRTVIHYHPPTQLESFLQEVGRAGRDGKPCLSLQLYRDNDIHIPLSMIDNELPTQYEVETIFRRLQQLQKEGKQLPKNTASIVNFLEMEETKWRLLQYQLELYQILNNDLQMYPFDREKWLIALDRIQTFCEDRLKYKRKKMWEMINWLTSEECLRHALYKPFKEEIPPKDYQCCSNCGFTESDFQQTNISHVANEKNWQKNLKEIFLMKEINNA